MAATDTTGAADAPIIEVEKLAVDFWVGKEWVTAVNDVSYRVNPGEVLAIVGESGSGKSVSSMSLLGLLPPNSRSRGSVKLRGKEILTGHDTENIGLGDSPGRVLF